MQMNACKRLFLAYDNETHLLGYLQQLFKIDQLHCLLCRAFLRALLESEGLRDDSFFMDCHKCSSIWLETVILSDQL